MNESHRPWLRWAALPLAAACLFTLGRWTAPEQAAPAAPSAQQVEPADASWTCAMHPQIRTEEPGTCPLCGMDLVRVEQGQAATAAHNRVTLTERARALARLRTQLVQPRSEQGGHRRLLGRVETDETAAREVTAWTGGRIDKLLVRFTGQRVRKGQTVARLYSPEVYNAHQDLLLARRQTRALAEGTPAARHAAQAALEAARGRLRLLGVLEEELQRMEQAPEPWRDIPIRSPFAGTITEHLATEGAYVKTGTALFRLSNLGRLWVQLDAYESDLPSLRRGQSVTLRFEGLADEPFAGKVAFIDPVLDPQRRTARVRVELRGGAGKVRPGMFAEASVETGESARSRSPLVIARSAPLFTGRRSVVFVEVRGTDRPTYEAREVRLGERLGDHYEVVSGLSEGERVVVNGAFTLDAELQIRGGRSMMDRPDDRQRPPVLPAAAQRLLAALVGRYLAGQRALAADRLPDAGVFQGAVPMTLDGVDPLSQRQLTSLDQALRTLGAAKELPPARAALGEASVPLTALLDNHGNPLSDPLQVAYCPMALEDEGAVWVQTEGALKNAYFGSRMLDCGEVKQTLPPSAEGEQSGEASR